MSMYVVWVLFCISLLLASIAMFADTRGRSQGISMTTFKEMMKWLITIFCIVWITYMCFFTDAAEKIMCQ